MLAAVLTLALIAAGVFVTQYTLVDGKLYRRDVQELDFRGQALSPEEFVRLREAFPDCHIRWDVPMDGKKVDSQSQSITLSRLNEEDYVNLQYLPALTLIDLTTQDLQGLAAWQSRRPDLQFTYRVSLSGDLWQQDTQVLSLPNAQLEQLEEALPFLPQLRQVTLLGKLPPAQQLLAFCDAHPELSVDWSVGLQGLILPRDAKDADLTGCAPEDLADALAYLPQLERLVLLENDLPNDRVLELKQRYPALEILCQLTLGGKTFRSDVQQLDFSRIPFDSVEELEALLPCLPQLETVEMCGCGISNQEMDGLNQRHPEVNFVWEVTLGPHITIRTDEITFMPYKFSCTVDDEDLYNLRYCRDMVCIDLGHMKITNIDFAENMPHLKYLMFGDTPVTSLEPLRNARELIFLEAFMTKVKDFSPLLGCTAMEDLNLCFTEGDVTPLAQMTWVKRLWKAGQVSPADQAMLRSALPDTQMVFYSLGSTNDGWRKGQNYYDMRDLLGMWYMD